MMCRVCIWVRRALLLLHDDAAGYVMLVAVCAYTHTSSCALSPWRAAYVQGCSLHCDAPGGSLCCSPFRGDATGYVLFVVVHVSMHASSCVLSP